MATKKLIFEVKELYKSFSDKKVLKGLTFNIYKGESFVILGRSGCGKSVTLKHLNGLIRPDRGSIKFEGEEITSLSEYELYNLRKKVSMLFQGGALFDSMTVLENIAFPLLEHSNLSPEEIKKTVREKLDLVELGNIEDKYPAELSGGMKKRVALARALAIDPEVVLFDEPTTGLDPMTSASIAHLIRSIQKQLGVTAIVITHDIPLTKKVADRIAFLEGGKFIFTGSWQEAISGKNLLVKNFIEGKREEELDV